MVKNIKQAVVQEDEPATEGMTSLDKQLSASIQPTRGKMQRSRPFCCFLP